ncbi:uncharacterized protein LOC123318294 [Coccinella septempunctata]|uniref:uncharacterized protein LOC123318294 n=1 Tax=Coccinella septempunctata TaxID=41139 RepID=UPI001D076B07|nr:uncharacterized protein LOC123318294 [Coccinella septempunctata]
MGFYDTLHQTYGTALYQHAKHFKKINKKLASLYNRRVFLLQCRMLNIYPRHIINSLKSIYTLQFEGGPIRKKVDIMMRKFRRNILNLEIETTIWKIKNYEHEGKKVIEILERQLTVSHFVKLNHIISSCFNALFNRIKQANISKLQSLTREHTPVVSTADSSSKRIYNYTNVSLPPKVEELLQFGPKFNVPFLKKEIPVPRIIADVEYYISSREVNETFRDTLRADFVNLLTNYLHRVNGRVDVHDKMVRNFNITKRFLKDNNDIIVNKSDKGGSIVIMYREDYVNHVKGMLSDVNTYKLLKKDPTSSFQKRANALVDSLFENSFISEFEKKKLKKHNSVPPRLYCLRKTHKEGLHMRPIVSGINSPSSNIATFIHNTLSDVATTFQHQVNSSFEFVEFSKNVVLPDGYVLVSLDVTSLFTNITHALTVQIIKKNWQTISAYTCLDRKTFLMLVDFLFESSYFMFNGETYLQIEGTTMGGIASPIFGKFVMNDLVITVVSQLPFPVPFVKFYVDDSVMALPFDMIDETVKIFNSYHDKIQFTFEVETGGSLPFLDVCLHRTEEQKIITNWYTKPTSSGIILNYLSNHATSYKISAINNLLHRAINLSSPVYHDLNIKKVKHILRDNKYPKPFVDRIVSELLRKRNNEKTVNTTTMSKAYFKFPYVPELSQKIKRTLKTENSELVFYNMKTVGSLYSKIKDPINKDHRSGVIYGIPCLDCDKMYIGQTRQYLQNRIKQHAYDVRDVKNRERTALCSHFFKDDHRPDEANESLRNVAEYTLRSFESLSLSRKIQLSIH